MIFTGRSLTTNPCIKRTRGENLRRGKIIPVGVLNANVEYKDQPPLLVDLYVVENRGPVLMGRDWLHDIPLDWYAIKSLGVSQAPPVGRVSADHAKQM